jgi:hypothetical protein
MAGETVPEVPMARVSADVAGAAGNGASSSGGVVVVDHMRSQYSVASGASKTANADQQLVIKVSMYSLTGAMTEISGTELMAEPR